MKTFEIEFIHTVEETYTATVEADSEDEALKIFREDPFSHVADGYPSDYQGIDIDIENVEEVT